MTILFLARRFHPLIGGVEKHVYEVSKRLVKKGHKVIVITEQTSNFPRFEAIYPRGLEVYRIKAGGENYGKKFRVWKELWTLRAVIQSADIIHCHDVFFWYLPFRFLYPQKPVYTTFHGYESYPIRKKAILVRKLTEKLSWGNICIGDFIKKWYGTKPTAVSYGAVDASAFHSSKKPKKDSAVFIGRLDEQTGVLTYVDAIKLVRKNNSMFRFLIVGDGKYKKVASKNAEVAGFQKYPEKYLAASHFAFVSRYLGILEAFAARRLVFAVYDNPVKEDYLRLTPFAEMIVITNNPQELADQVAYFLKNPEEEAILVDKAFKWVQKQTWEKMVQIYVNLWQE